MKPNELSQFDDKSDQKCSFKSLANSAVHICKSLHECVISYLISSFSALQVLHLFGTFITVGSFQNTRKHNS